MATVVFCIILILQFSSQPTKKSPVHYIFYQYIWRKTFFKEKEKNGTLCNRSVPPFYSTKFYIKRQNLIHYYFFIKQRTDSSVFIWKPYIANIMVPLSRPQQRNLS